MSESGFTQSSAAEQQSFPPTPAARSIWPWVLLFGGVALMLVVRSLYSPHSAAGRSGGNAPGVGASLSTVALVPLTGDGTAISPADLQGKVTLLNFWGPWCGPCAIEFPHLLELVKHFEGEADFQFVSVSSNPDPTNVQGLAEDTSEFLRQHRAEIRTFRDADGQTIDGLVRDAKLAGFGFPTTVVTDRSGVIRGIWVGYQPGDEKAMRQAVQQLLDGKAAGAVEPPPVGNGY